MKDVSSLAIACSFALIILLFILILRFLTRRNRCTDFNGKHCIVTGGSSGIGKNIALLLANEGAHVTIVARNVERLKSALSEMKENAADGAQKFSFLSLNLGSCPYEEVRAAFAGAQEDLGPCMALFNIAGHALPLPFDELPIESMEDMLRSNLLAAMHTTRAVLSDMKSRKEGRIVYTSSMAGFMGLFGYSVYSASKFGLRGFAEAISMEASSYNIAISVAFPPDTLTPGFEKENMHKNLVTARISADGSVFNSKKVSQDILKGVKMGNFIITSGFDGWLTSLGCAAFSPSTSVIDSFFAIMGAGIVRFFSLLYLYRWYGFAKDFMVKKVRLGHKYS